MINYLLHRGVLYNIFFFFGLFTHAVKEQTRKINRIIFKNSTKCLLSFTFVTIYCP